MNYIHRNLLRTLFLFLVITPGFIQAQHWLGYANSNYSGTNGMYLNPASMASNKYNFYMNLAGLNVNFHNDYLKLNMPYSPWRALTNKIPTQYLTDQGNPKFEPTWLKENLNGKNKDVSLLTEVRGPSFLIGLGPKHTIAVGTRVRTMVQLMDINENLARIIRWGTSPTELAFSGPDSLGYGIEYGQQDFALNVNAYSELSLSYATVLYNKKATMIKGGLTVKRLVGIYSAYFQNGPGGSIVVHKDDSMGFLNSSLAYGYVNENYYTQNGADISLSRILFKDRLGAGWGFDIGFAYEYRPDYEEYNYTMDRKKRYDRASAKHKYRIAAAISDIGNINYNNSKWVGERVLPPNLTRHLGSLDTLKKMFDDFGQEAEDANGYDKMNDYIGQIAGGFAEANNSFRSRLPTTFNLQFDYNVVGPVFINATYIQSLRRKGQITMRHFNQLSVTPRFESNWWGAAVPLVINNDFRSVNFGICLKLGPVVIGSDRIGSLLFNSKNLYGMDLYTAVVIPIVYKRPKDRDRDMVSDRLDLCPDSTGSAKLKGCPDKDDDGVSDKDDRCPDEAGTKATKGCPDSDGDKVVDSEDNCPDVAGDKETHGCPDSDGDGILDDTDACPDEKGPAMTAGCPDSDGDGIPDNTDKCPGVKGLRQYAGCPEEEKEEPAKPVEPTTPIGPKSEEQILQDAYDNLLFATGSAVIKEESYATLDKLAQLMQVKKNYLLNIEGHTDNVGDPGSNLALSKQRAASVKKYLVSKGVDSKRMFTEGFGDTRPVASNATEAGRKKNRRVEFLVMRLAE